MARVCGLIKGERRGSSELSLQLVVGEELVEDVERALTYEEGCGVVRGAGW